jgi:glutamate synthase (NADPH/NADH)
MGRTGEGLIEHCIEEEKTNVYDYQNTPENRSWAGALPLKQGLYDPELEKDSCGVGFAA